MKSKLLYYLSFIFLLSAIACSEDDEIPELVQPEDAKYYTFKPLQITNKVDSNGNAYIVSGTLLVDADINVEEDPNRTADVIIQIVRVEGDVETELARGNAFNLSGSSEADAQSFNLDFGNISTSQTEIDIAANLLEASSGRKLKGIGLIQKIESVENDIEWTYKFKDLVFTGVDANSDGYFVSREVSFRVAIESNTPRELTGQVQLLNDNTGDTALVATLPQFTVTREGSSPTTFDVVLDDDADSLTDLSRSRYEVIFTFFSVETGEIVFQETIRAANGYPIGFEPATYDQRDWDLDSASVSLIPQGGNGTDTLESLIVDLVVLTDVDFPYFGTNDPSPTALRYPKVRIQYELLETSPGDRINLETSVLSGNPFNAQFVNFEIIANDVLPTNDPEEIAFYIQILEDQDNYLTPQLEDIVLHEYGPSSFPGLQFVMTK